MPPLLHAAFDVGYFLDRLQPDELLWRALWYTVLISVVAQVLGTILGVISASFALSRRGPLRAIAGVYVWVFRGTPVILQIVFWYNGMTLLLGYDLFPRVMQIGPFELKGAIAAGIVALAMNEGAYMSEIVRAGILSVDEGQVEAALVVGMTEEQATRRIVLPQAARLIVPGLGNEFNNMLKTSSLVSVIGVTELYQEGQIAVSSTFQYPEVFMAVAAWYLVLTSLWMLVQVQIERALGRSDRIAGETFLARLLGAGQRRKTYS
ncbi:MAG: amino acid transporter rane protein family [Thermoleophilia bacterium]|nr:amino acid transporter rane protein family [Thermoleophilia bacterium]